MSEWEAGGNEDQTYTYNCMQLYSIVTKVVKHNIEINYVLTMASYAWEHMRRTQAKRYQLLFWLQLLFITNEGQHTCPKYAHPL